MGCFGGAEIALIEPGSGTCPSNRRLPVASGPPGFEVLEG